MAGSPKLGASAQATIAGPPMLEAAAHAEAGSPKLGASAHAVTEREFRRRTRGERQGRAERARTRLHRRVHPAHQPA
eukprot:891553-Alexandrium_andersonii.AAC.1